MTPPAPATAGPAAGVPAPSGRRPATAVGCRVGAAAVLAAAAVLVATHVERFRVGEAAVTAAALRHPFSLPASVFDHRPILVVGSVHHPFALVVTGSCSAAVAVAAVLGASAGLCVLRTSALCRVVAAAGTAAAVLVGANLCRLSTIALATHRWGRTGFDWTHRYVGTAMSVGAVTLAIAVYLAVLVLPAPRAGAGRH